MPNFPHKREFARLPVRLQIEISAGDLSIRCEETRDISLKGVYVMTGHRIPLGVECDIATNLGSIAKEVITQAEARKQA